MATPSTISGNSNTSPGARARRINAQTPSTTSSLTNNAPTLSVAHIFGVKQDVKAPHLWFLEDNMVLYVAGHNLVLYNTETKSQKLVPCSLGNEGNSTNAGIVASIN